MENKQIQDPIVFHILSRLERFGHPEVPLQIIKEKNSYIVGHKRKRFRDGSEYFAQAGKMTFVKSQNIWKLYWMRADLKWHLYEEYTNLDELLEELKTDPNGCFWG